MMLTYAYSDLFDGHLRFMHRHADGDLQVLLTSTVPPADLQKVTTFASHLAKFQQEVCQPLVV